MITGAGSYVGESVRSYMLAHGDYEIDAVDTMNDAWKVADFSQYDVVYHVAGIAHVNADPKMEPLYWKVNRDLTLEVARMAQEAGVKQFVFMSSQIVFHESQSLKSEMLTAQTEPNPNGFYGGSKLEAEKGLWELRKAGGAMKICVLRPPMIYGPNSKGNFPRLMALACKTPVFPAWHNKRSMLYIDNLAELIPFGAFPPSHLGNAQASLALLSVWRRFVKQCVDRELEGTFYPQNREQADTVEIIRFFAKAAGHKVWITKLLNPFVWLGSFVLQPINKMFATYYYDPEMSKYDFEYQLVSFEESLKKVAESLGK